LKNPHDYSRGVSGSSETEYALKYRNMCLIKSNKIEKENGLLVQTAIFGAGHDHWRRLKELRTDGERRERDTQKLNKQKKSGPSRL